jgi:Domain of unknown function (DUF4383)
MLTGRRICIAFGSVFVFAGFLGFIPNPIVSSEGIFETNAMHNLVHLLTGSAFLFGGLVLEGRESLVLNIITAAYFGVALLGFMTDGDSLLGLIQINEADQWLHLGLAIAMLIAAMASSKRRAIAQWA